MRSGNPLSCPISIHLKCGLDYTIGQLSGFSLLPHCQQVLSLRSFRMLTQTLLYRMKSLEADANRAQAVIARARQAQQAKLQSGSFRALAVSSRKIMEINAIGFHCVYFPKTNSGHARKEMKSTSKYRTFPVKRIRCGTTCRLILEKLYHFSLCVDVTIFSFCLLLILISGWKV